MRLWTSLTAGLTPEKLALIVAVGFVLGTFPVLGVASLLCLAGAAVLRLNVAALQAVGQAATPAQYALLLPLTHLGGRVLGWHAGIAAMVAHAVTGWLCVCVPLGVVLYFSLLLFVRRRVRHNVEAPETAA